MPNITTITAANIDLVMNELEDPISQTCQPRSNLQLEKFIVGDFETPERRYKHCIDELSTSLLQINDRKCDLENLIAKTEFLEQKLARTDPDRFEDAREEAGSIDTNYKIAKYKADICKNHLQIKVDSLRLEGLIREANTLWMMFNAFKRYTNDEIQQADSRYWFRRIASHVESLQITHNHGLEPALVDMFRKLGLRPDLGARFLAEQIVQGNIPEATRDDILRNDAEFIDAAMGVVTAEYGKMQAEQAAAQSSPGAPIEAEIVDPLEQPEVINFDTQP